MNNTCGTCTLCCKVMEVAELQKPYMQWCTHCDIGKGCKVYEERPKSCRDFECVWLQSQTDKPENRLAFELRPDQCHVVMFIGTDNDTLIAHTDTHYPGAAYHGPVWALLGRLIGKLSIIIAEGSKRKAYLLPEHEHKVISWLEQRKQHGAT